MNPPVTTRTAAGRAGKAQGSSAVSARAGTKPAAAKTAPAGKAVPAAKAVPLGKARAAGKAGPAAKTGPAARTASAGNATPGGKTAVAAKAASAGRAAPGGKTAAKTASAGKAAPAGKTAAAAKTASAGKAAPAAKTAPASKAQPVRKAPQAARLSSVKEAAPRDDAAAALGNAAGPGEKALAPGSGHADADGAAAAGRSVSAPGSSAAAGAEPAAAKAAATAQGEARGRTGQRGGGLVAFVGAGPGDEGLLTIRAAELLAKADLVVAGRELADRMERLVPPGAALADAEALQAEPRLMVKAARAGQLVVRLFGGDPMMFGQAAPEAVICARAKVPFEIVPGLSAATAVPAYAGIPLTSEATGAVRIIHATEASRTAAGPGTLVIIGAENGPADLAKMLIAAGWPDTSPLAITWNGTTTDQHTVVCTLATVSADLKAAGVSLPAGQGPAVAVVGDGVPAHRSLSWFETKPLFGWRVLVPRTKEQAGEVCERLRAYGAVPEQVPTIAVEPPRTPQQMERAVKGLVTGRYQWIGFTSVNAVRAVREKFEEYGLDARAFAGVKVAAVGEQTAQALRAFGIMPDLMPEDEQSADGLARAWPAYDDLLDPINRVLLPRADIATEPLLTKLTEIGWETEDVTAYRTVRAAPPAAPIREAIKGGGFDAVLFTSSSTVRNLIGIAGKPHPVTVISVIGPQTAKTAAEFGLRVDVTARKPSAIALVDALAAHGAAVRDSANEAGEPVRRPSERRRGARRRIR